MTNNIVKKLTCALLAVTMTFSAWAISLDDAKQQGLIGEMQNGYLGLVVEDVEAQSLVANVNEKRKSIYLNLARKNNITMAQVTALAAEKALNKTQTGHFIQNAAGQWVKK
ncbi:YdbL family protein [Colwellia sp. MB02u-10]|uniref:YdbL family protein n=1 Tax=Colwellia sp. MB02u-10 TaxID=2759828 RepID=UPI0015F58660|nr:YdbL family protein [Colwellia sp. MB02u-10]MBA6340294.1 YdbL family protein [Colwellia sp. MB02u-10]